MPAFMGLVGLPHASPKRVNGKKIGKKAFFYYNITYKYEFILTLFLINSD